MRFPVANFISLFTACLLSNVAKICAPDTSYAMSRVKTKKWMKRAKFEGMPKREDLEIVEEFLPHLKNDGKKRGGEAKRRGALKREM